MTRFQIASGATVATLAAGPFIIDSASIVSLVCLIVICAAALTIIVGIMLPAAWSRKPGRRADAYGVLRLILRNQGRDDVRQLSVLPDLKVSGAQWVEHQLDPASDQGGVD